MIQTQLKEVRKTLRTQKKLDLDKLFQEYIQIEKSLSNIAQIEKATDQFVIDDAKIKAKYEKLIKDAQEHKFDHIAVENTQSLIRKDLLLNTTEDSTQ